VWEWLIWQCFAIAQGTFISFIISSHLIWRHISELFSSEFTVRCEATQFAVAVTWLRQDSVIYFAMIGKLGCFTEHSVEVRSYRGQLGEVRWDEMTDINDPLVAVLLSSICLSVRPSVCHTSKRETICLKQFRCVTDRQTDGQTAVRQQLNVKGAVMSLISSYLTSF